MTLPAINTILYIVIGVFFFISILWGLIQGAKKNIYFLFSSIIFWVVFFITAKLLSPLIKQLAESSEFYSLISSLTGDTTSKNLIEYGTTMIGSMVNMPAEALQSEGVISIVVSIVHLVLKLVYLLILWIVYGILSLIVYGIFFKKYSVTSRSLLKKLQTKERNNYMKNLPYNKTLGRNLRRISRNIKHNGANKALGLLTGFLRGAIACFLVLSIINALVFTLPDFSKIDTTNPESSSTEENYELYSYISTLENGAYKDIVDYIIDYQKTKLSRVTAIEINGKPADKMFLDAILSGESTNFAIELRSEIEQFVKLAVIAQQLTNNFNFQNIDFLNLSAEQIELLKTLIISVSNDALVKNLLPIAVSFALSLDAVKAYIPSDFDTSVLDTFDWSKELVAIANLVVSVYELGGENGLKNLDYLNLDGTKVKAVCSNLGKLQCLQIALELGGSYAVDNLLADLDDNQKATIKDDLAQIVLKDDLEDIGDIYTEFLAMELGTKFESSKGEDESINYIKALTSVESEDYNAIVNTLFETSFMIKLLPDVLTIVKTKYVPQEYADMINPNITAAADWKAELNTVIDIIGELTQEGTDPIQTLETIPLNRLTNISTNTIVNSKLLSYATITILVQSSKGEGFGSALQEYIKVPDNLTVLNSETHTYPAAWYPTDSTSHDGELYVMFNTIKNAASEIDDINSITNSIVPMITSINATEISSSTVLQYSISNLLFSFGKDYIVVPYSCYDTVTCSSASLNVIKTQELENILTAITDENVLNYDAAFKYTYKNDNEEDVVVYKESDVPEGKDAIKELNLTDTQSIINVVLSTKLYDPDHASDVNLNKLFASKILRATITDLVESLAGEFIKLPGAALEEGTEKALDKEGVEKTIDIVKTQELNNLVKVFMKLDIDITSISSNPLSILDKFGTESAGVKTFNATFTQSIFNSEGTDYSSIIHFTFSDLLMNSSDLLGDSFTIAIPNEAKNNGYIIKDEIVNLFKSVYYLDINAIKESADVNSILSVILDNTHKDELFDSNILRATITNLLAGDDLGISLPKSNEGIESSTEYIYSTNLHITYSETSELNNLVITSSELNKILDAIKALKDEITGGDPEVSFDLSTVFTSIKIGTINNIKEDLLASKIISATVSKLIIDMADPSSSFELVIASSICNGTYITNNELSNLFDTLTTIVGADTSIDNIGDINIDTILDNDAEDLLKSNIIANSIANVLAGLTMIDIPTYDQDSTLYTSITKLNATTTTNIISTDEITNIIKGIQAFKAVVQGSSTTSIPLEDLFDFSSLTLSKINEATDDLLKSNIIRYTITNKITGMSSGSFDLIVENSVYESPYIKTTELSNLFNSLTLLVGNKTIDEIGDVNIDSILEVDRTELFKSVILKDSIANLVATLDAIEIPTKLQDAALYQQITKYNEETTTDIITYTELDAIFEAINALMDAVKTNPEDTVALDDLFDFSSLTLSKLNTATNKLLGSKIIKYTISKKVMDLADGSSDFKLIIKCDVFESPYISTTELTNLFNVLTGIAGDQTIDNIGSISTDSILEEDTDTLFSSSIIKYSVSNVIKTMDGIDKPIKTQDPDVYEDILSYKGQNVELINISELTNILNGIKALKAEREKGGTEVSFEDLFDFSALKIGNINAITDDLLASKIISYTISKQVVSMATGSSGFKLVIIKSAYDGTYITNSELKLLFSGLTTIVGEDTTINGVSSVDTTSIINNDKLKDTFTSSIISASVSGIIDGTSGIIKPTSDTTVYETVKDYTDSNITLIKSAELSNIITAVQSLLDEVNGSDLNALFNFSSLTIGNINDVKDDLLASKILSATISDQILSLSSGSFNLIINNTLKENTYYINNDELKLLFTSLKILAGENTTINNISSVNTDDVLDNPDIKTTFESQILKATISNIICGISGLVIPVNDTNVITQITDVSSTTYKDISKDELEDIIDVYDALTAGTSNKGTSALQLNNLKVSKINAASEALSISRVINATITDKLKTNSAIQIGIDSNYTSINDSSRKIITDTNKYYITNTDLIAFFASVNTIAGENDLSNIQVETSTILGMTETQLNTLFGSEILVNTVSTKIYDAFGTNLEFLNYSDDNDHGYTQTTITKTEEVNLFLALQVVRGSASDISSITFDFNTLTSLDDTGFAKLCNSNLISYNVYNKIKAQNDDSEGFNGLLKLEADEYDVARSWFMDTQTATDDDLYNLLIAIKTLYSDDTSKAALTGGVSSTTELAKLIGSTSQFIPTMTNNKILCDSLPNIVDKFSNAVPSTMRPTGSFHKVEKSDTTIFPTATREAAWKEFWQLDNGDINEDTTTAYAEGELYRLINGIIKANDAATCASNVDITGFNANKAKAEESVILKKSLTISFPSPI